MLVVSIRTALLICFALFLFIYLGAWVFYHLKQRKKTALPAANKLTTCEHCHYAYLSNALKPISKCPQCYSYN